MQTLAESDTKIEQLKGQLATQQLAFQAQQQAHQTKLDTYQSTLESKNRYIGQLEDYIKTLRHSQYGTSSEKLDTDQLPLFNEAEELDQVDTTDQSPAEVKVNAHTRQTKPRISIPNGLPREVIIHDLSEDDKVCPHDGTVLRAIGEKTHEQLDIIPAQVKVLRHVRKTYACPCCQDYLVTAAKPKQAIEKSIASPGLLAYIAVNKYADSLPLYRQSQIFKRLGIELDRTNLANWMVRCGQLLEPLMDQLRQHLCTHTVLHMDETPLQVLNEPGKAAHSQSYMWVMASSVWQDKPAVVFHYADCRSGSVPEQLLTDYQGALMSDGYEGYQRVCDQRQLTRLGCMAHARRGFIKAQRQQSKGKTGKADQALAYIQKLYVIERQCKTLAADERYRIRQQQAKPIIDKLRQWLHKSLAHTPPKSTLGKALHYLHNQWDRLTGYLDDGLYPIDNNRVENAIRPFVIGRKNWLFSASVNGAKASANLYSLIETAKLNGLEPYQYLRQMFTQLPQVQTTDQLKALLPWNIKM